MEAKCSGVCPSPPLCVHHARIRRHQLSQLRHHSQPRSRVRIQHCAAFDQKLHHARIAIVQHAESAGPPLGSLLDVGARAQQHIDCRPIAPLYCREQRVLAEAVVGQRIVDLRPQFRISPEDFADARRIAVAHCRLQRLCRTEPQRLDV